MKRNLFTIMLAFLVVFGVNAQKTNMLSVKGGDKEPVINDYVFTPSITGDSKGALSEGFEDATFPPSGWKVINGGDANTWVRYETAPHTGVASAAITYGSTAHDDYLVTPKLIVTATDHTLTGWFKSQSSSYLEPYDVMVSTTGTDVGDFSLLVAEPDPGTTWVEKSYDLSAYDGQNIYVAFRSTTTDQFRLYIDDVTGPEVYVAPHDMAVINVSPTFVYSGSTVTPKVTVHNFGGSEETTYTVVLNDGTSDISTINVTTAIASGADAVIDMDTWTPADGNYTLTATVTVTDDVEASNDAMSVNCDVASMSYTEGFNYGYSAYGTLVDNFTSNDLVGGSLQSIGTTTTSNFLIAGDYINGTVVGIEVTSNDVYYVNGNGSGYKVGTITGTSTILGLAHDNDNDIVYAVDSDNNLFTINMSDFTATLIGAVGYGCFGIAYADGVLYAVESGNSDLISIDVTNGTATVIGNTGLSLNYAQDIGSDKNRGILYGTLYTSTGGFYSIDKTTGVATLINNYSDEVTMCAIVPTPISTDATLSALTYDGTSVPSFDATTYTYDVELPYGTTVVPTVVGTPTDANATAVTTDAVALPGSSTVLVTAEDGTTQLTYTVNFTVAAPATDATLSALTYDGTSVSSFDPATYTYNVELVAGTTDVPTVVGTPTDANATAVTTDATALPGASTVLVTAEDGTTELTYTINFTVAISVNNIASKGISVYPNPSNGTFTVNVENDFNLEVLDITGKVINTQVLNGTNTVNINNAGVYFLRFSNKEGSVTQKVIVQ